MQLNIFENTLIGVRGGGRDSAEKKIVYNWEIYVGTLCEEFFVSLSMWARLNKVNTHKHILSHLIKVLKWLKLGRVVCS